MCVCLVRVWLGGGVARGRCGSEEVWLGGGVAWGRCGSEEVWLGGGVFQVWQGTINFEKRTHR